MEPTSIMQDISARLEDGRNHLRRFCFSPQRGHAIKTVCELQDEEEITVMPPSDDDFFTLFLSPLLPPHHSLLSHSDSLKLAVAVH